MAESSHVQTSFPNVATQFQPGKSGNPGGRPKGRSVLARLNELMERGDINGSPVKGGKQVADLVAEALLKGLLEGDIRYIELFIKYTEVPVRQRVEVTGAGGAPLVQTPEIGIVANALGILSALGFRDRASSAGEQPADTVLPAPADGPSGSGTLM